MSAYEDYAEAAAHYDASRGAAGVEIVLGCLGAGLGAVAGAAVLDAGCGTGNYAAALAAAGARVLGVDREPAMLGRAAAKLAGRAAALARARLEALPVAPAGVDGAVVNQVLHHLPGAGGDGWRALRAVAGELARVVRPGGVLVVNACTPEQIRRGWWYRALVPEAFARMEARHAPWPVLAEILDRAGFAVRDRIVPLELILQGPECLDGRRLLDPAFRRGDSMWALVDGRTLAQAEAALRAMAAAGTLAGFVARHDRGRREVGQTTFTWAVRRGG